MPNEATTFSADDVANQLAHHRAIFAFYQRVVLAAAGPAFGELGVQLLQHLRHSMIDVFRAVVDVKPQYHERKLRQHCLQLSAFHMRTCTQPRHAYPILPGFMLILHWKPP